MFTNETTTPFEAGTTKKQAAAIDGEKVRDASGYAVFCSDDDGAAHVMAHRMLDEGRIEEGYRRLSAWLHGRTGGGSRWVHLQWHMAVFALGVGLLDEAFARLVDYILPAVPLGDALTDAPALLWRLSLASRGRLRLPWEAVRTAALPRMGSSSAYVELHHLLALGGAGDLGGLDAWLDLYGGQAVSESGRILQQWCRGLRAFAARDWGRASRLLGPVATSVGRLGGSGAQNQLFEHIAHEAARRAESARRLREPAGHWNWPRSDYGVGRG